MIVMNRLLLVVAGLLVSASVGSAIALDSSSPMPNITPSPAVSLTPATVVITPPPSTTEPVLGAHEALQEDIADQNALDEALAEIDWEGLAALALEDQRITRQMEVDEARMMFGRCGEWHELAISIGWPESDWPWLQNTIYHESRCQADAWNGQDAGLLQINRVHTEWISQMGLGTFPDSMFDPASNLRFGLALFQSSGCRPWRYSGSC